MYTTHTEHNSMEWIKYEEFSFYVFTLRNVSRLPGGYWYAYEIGRRENGSPSGLDTG